MPTAGTLAAASDSSNSKFLAGDAGWYGYKVVAVTSTGVSAPITSLTGPGTLKLAVAADEKVTLTITDNALQDGPAGNSDTDIKYYRVYRSAKAAVTGDVDFTTCKFMMQFPAIKDADTICVDHNKHIPGTSQVYVMQSDPSVMYWAQLLDFTRRPLAQVNTTIPFLLMMFGSLHVKVPTKCWTVDNVGFTL